MLSVITEATRNTYGIIEYYASITNQFLHLFHWLLTANHSRKNV